MENKYEKLREYLKKYTLTLSYRDIEKIIGIKLPKSAYIHKAWWSNAGHKHAENWTSAGWKVKTVKLGESITFKPDIT